MNTSLLADPEAVSLPPLQLVGDTFWLHFKGASNRRSFIRWSLICRQLELLHFDKVSKLALHLNAEEEADLADVEVGEKKLIPNYRK